MITIRSAKERGNSRMYWLDSHHTFSFGEYYDDTQMGFRALRVINEDTVRAGAGFGTHPHRDMEIITYVLEGELEHKDSMGTGSVIAPGEIQRMSAGTGVTHSEYNHSKANPVHFLQIWILPEKHSIAPSYEQKSFDKSQSGKLQLIADQQGKEQAVTVHQDVQVFTTILKSGDQVEYAIKSGRHAWVQVARGEVQVNNKELGTGDGAAVSNEAKLTISASKDAEVLLFDLA